MTDILFSISQIFSQDQIKFLMYPASFLGGILSSISPCTLGILPLIVASLIFIVLPNKLLQNLSNLVYVKKSEMSSRSAINTTRKNLRKRMSELSNIFMEMKQIHLIIPTSHYVLIKTFISIFESIG